MQFQVESEFDAPVEAVAAAMLHPDYRAFLLERHSLLDDVRELSREEDGQVVRRRMHYTPHPAFERIGTKKVDPEWFEFVEESAFDRASHRLTFDNVPITPKVARRMRNRGQLELTGLPGGRTLRRTRVELSLHSLPLLVRPLGSLAEQMLSREARKLLEAEAEVLAQWLARG